MNALDRANAFLRNRAVKLALTVIPLATIAASTAQAVTMSAYNLCLSGAPNCRMTVTPSATIGGEPLPITGYAFGYNITASPTSRGGVSLTGPFTFQVFGAGDYKIGVEFSGPTQGVPLGADGVQGSYLFNIDPGDGTVNSWEVAFGIVQNGGEVDGSPAIGTTLHGAGYVGVGPLDPTSAATQWDMLFLVDWSTTEGGTLRVDLPLTEDPTPEPASVLLLVPGIGLLALLRRRRKA